AMIFCHIAFWFAIPARFIGLGAAIGYYFAWTAFAGVYLMVIIPVNHVGTNLIDPGSPRAADFIEHQITASRNITGPVLSDHRFIGTNLQIEHHLFPFVPATRLRAGREVLRAFCREQELPYLEQRYVSALVDVYRQFAVAARAAKKTRGGELTLEGSGPTV